MKKIFRGWYKETHLGDIAIEGTDIIEMNQEAYEEFLERAQDLGYTDIDNNISINYKPGVWDSGWH
jgi:hypothetical protein